MTGVRLATLALLGWLAISPLGAQGLPSLPGVTEAQESADVAPATEASAAFPLAELPAEAEALDALLRRVESSLDDPPRWAAVSAAIAGLEEDLGPAAEQVQSLDATTVALRDLDELGGWWRRQESAVAEVAARIETRWQGLIELRAALTGAEARWTATAEALAEDEIPSETDSVAQRIDSLLAALGEAQQAVQRRLDPVLDLLERVGNLEAKVQRSQLRIVQLASSARVSMTRRDHPALWEARAWTDTGRSPRLEWHVEQLVEYVRSERRLLVEQLAIFGAVLLLLIWLRGRAPLLRDDPGRPLLPLEDLLGARAEAAFVFAAVAGHFRHARAPWWWNEIVLLLVLVPLARLLGPAISASRRRLLRAVLAAAAVMSVVSISPVHGGPRRLLLTFLLAVLLGALWRARRRLPKAPADVRARLVAIGLAALITVLLVAVIALVSGWVALGEFLAFAAVASVVLALAIFSVGLIADCVARAVLRDPWIEHLSSVEPNRQRLAKIERVLVLGACAYLALQEVLQELLLFAPLRDWVGGLLSATMTFGDFEISLSRIGTLALVLAATILLARVLKIVLLEDVLPRVGISRAAAYAYGTLTYYVIVAIGIVAAASAAGLGGTQLTVLAGALGVGIGFGLQTIVNNFVSGLILIFERPIKLGDMIEIGHLTGEVTKIGIRASTVRTLEGSEVVVPNGTLVADQVVNWTLSDRQRRLTVKVGVAYGTDPEVVLELLRKVAERHPRILASPAPNPLFVAFGESSLDFELRCWTFGFEEYYRVLSDLSVEVNRELAEAGIVIPFPQRTLHVATIAPDVAASVRPPPAADGAEPAD